MFSKLCYWLTRAFVCNEIGHHPLYEGAMLQVLLSYGIEEIF